MSDTPKTDPADVVDPETGMTPREAAGRLIGLEHEMLYDPVLCGRSTLIAETHGADWDDPVLLTMRRWHARRQDAAAKLAEAVRSFLAPHIMHNGRYALLWDALFAYDAAHGKHGE